MLTSHCFGKTKPGHLEQQSKNHLILQQAPETSLKRYKNSYFDSYIQKQLFLYLQIKKNMFFTIIGGWYVELSIELEVKVFLALNNRTNISWSVSKQILWTTYFAENKVKVQEAVIWTWKCSVKKISIKIWQNSKENTSAGVSFWIQLHAGGL